MLTALDVGPSLERRPEFARNDAGVDLGEGRETLLGEVDGLVRVELVVLDFSVCLCLFETVVVREYLRLDPGNGLFGRREVASCSAGFDLGLRELEGGEE